MKTNLLLVLTLFLSVLGFSQTIVINEFDTQTPGQDYEEFVELRSEMPNTPLDGYVLVFFNGSASGDDRSYFTLDLDGTTTDINGLLLIGSTGVSPIPDVIVPPAFIQNGADAVAVYLGDDTDFPDQTQATSENLIDALIYDTNDADDTGLMALLGIDIQINEDENGNDETESIQRDTFENATYTVTTPTPGALNDGSGFDFNGISFSTNQEDYEEGETMVITFTTEFPVDNDLNLDFTLINGTFNSNDFTGTTSFTIPTGESSATVSIELIDDDTNDGDEFAEIDLGAIPEGYNRLIDNVEVLVNDVNFTMAAWGTPLVPTFGMVQSTQPDGYYDTLEGLADDALRQAMQDIVADPNTVRTQTYADIVNILKDADQNPANSNEVWLLYTEQGRKKIKFQNQGGSSVGLWNREHTYPQSRGNFGELEDVDEVADGMDVFIQTAPDSLRHAFSDGHGLRAADGPENSSRGNQDYGQYSGPTGNAGSWQGDVARAVMFLAVRYDALTLVEGDPDDSTDFQLGDLTVLLDWHRNDPPDDFELNRNNVVYTWQRNRNPFIDDPILVEHIWGNMQGMPYEAPLSINTFDSEQLVMYPNPSNGTLNVAGLEQIANVTIFNTLGQKVMENSIAPNQSLQLTLDTGIYTVVLYNETASWVKKLIVN
tara:strand:- start:2550 stop:4523 length:1974 start_codon:yes stop_codon:yes gene_type:complete